MRMKCTVFMMGSAYDSIPERVKFMELMGGTVYRSPNVQEQNMSIKSGNMGIASSEAIQYSLQNSSKSYRIAEIYGSIIFQSIIGIEARMQMDELGESVDELYACVGGGSNFGGISSVFVKDKIEDKRDIKIVAVEPVENPTLTQGEYKMDYGDYYGLTPKMKMYTLGNHFMMKEIYANGLRYHGMDTVISKLYHDRIITACAYEEEKVMECALTFFAEEGILPAPESAYAIAAAMDAAVSERNKNILICVSGHGYLNINNYYDYRLKKDPFIRTKAKRG